VARQVKQVPDGQPIVMFNTAVTHKAVIHRDTVFANVNHICHMAVICATISH